MSASAALTVRQAVAADLDAVVALRLALLREHSDHPIYGRLRPDAERRARKLFAAQLASPNEATFLAASEPSLEAVGILRCIESVGSPLLFPERYAYLSSAYVVPSRRRRGVLSALLANAIAWARGRGLEEIRLHNVPDAPAASVAWAALGFDVVEQLRVRSIAGHEPK